MFVDSKLHKYTLGSSFNSLCSHLRLSHYAVARENGFEILAESSTLCVRSFILLLQGVGGMRTSYDLFIFILPGWVISQESAIVLLVLLLVVLVKRVIVYALCLQGNRVKEKLTELPLWLFLCRVSRGLWFRLALLGFQKFSSLVFNVVRFFWVNDLQDFKLILSEKLVFAPKILRRAVSKYLKLKVAWFATLSK